jgi:serine phosphatase RsbU (regulator of sigma subunit)
MMLKSFKARISASFFLLALFVSLFFFVVLYARAAKDQLESLRVYLKNTAALGAVHLSAEDVLKIPREPGCEKNPVRQGLVRELRKITKIDPRIDDAYVMIPTGKDQNFVFVANANQEVSPVACGELYDTSRYPEIARALQGPAADRVVTKDKWGFWLSGYAPLYDAHGHAVAILGLDVAERVIQELRAAFLQYFAITILMALILALLIGLLSSQWLTKPIQRIIDGMERVSDGDLNYDLKMMTQAEFNKIVRIFNDMTHALRDLVRKLTRSVAERERINRELEIAADLQQKALPAAAPAVAGLEIAAKSIPAREVGGDYFDFVPLKSGKTGFVIADAAGKGFSGTLFMTNSRSVFRVISSEEEGPARVLRRANDYIACDGASTKGLFITFLYVVYEPRARELVYANAGHFVPVVYESRFRRFKSLKGGGLPLGIYPNEEYAEESTTLSPGDVLVMYTDGILEAADSKKDMFGLGRLMTLVEAHAAEKPQDILNHITQAVKDFVGDQAQSDDITLVVLKAV